MHLKERPKKLKSTIYPLSDLEEKITDYKISNITISKMSKIFEYNDVYIQYFLLTTNKFRNFSINSNFVHKIIEMIKNIKKLSFVKYNTVNINEKMIEWLKTNLKIFNYSGDAISILEECELTENDKSFFRKYFGYNLIYKEFKKIIDNSSTKNLPILLVLLDNNKICYNRLLEIYKKLNYYLENNILDRNFIFCSKVLYYLLNYDFKMFSEEYKDFLLGFSIYLLDLIYTPDTYKIFELEDIEVFIKMIRIIYVLGSDKYKKGIYLKCLEHSLHLFTNVFEDTLMLIFTLEVLDFTEFNFKDDSIELLHDNLESFSMSTLFKPYKEYEFMITRFLKCKYRILSKLKHLLSKTYDKVKLYNELYNNDKYNELVLKFCTIISLDYIIDNLIILINNSSYKIQYINILFDNMGEKDLSYLYLYLLALKDNSKYVFYFVKYFVNMGIMKNRRYFEMLMMIYFMFIEEENIYIKKSRMEIIRYLQKTEEICIDTIISEIKKYNKRHKNIFILIYYVSKYITKVESEDFVFLYKYLLEELNDLVFVKTRKYEENNNCARYEEGECTFTIEKFEMNYKLKYFYYKVCLDLLTKCEDDKKIELVKSKNFNNIMIMLLYFQKIKQSFEMIQLDIFEFIFTCSKYERKEIYKIIFINKSEKKNKVQRIDKKYNL